MRILITGGAGFIGSAVAQRLLQEGHTIGIIDNFSNSYKENIPKGSVLYECDITLPTDADRNAFKAAFTNAELVIHCAAIADVQASAQECWQTNVIGGINVLEEMVRRGIKRIINASSAAVYGNGYEYEIEEEDDTFPINPYGLSKLMFEDALFYYWGNHDINCTNFRFFNVVGPGQNRRNETHLIQRALMAMKEGRQVEIYGEGSQIRDYVHINDVIDLFVSAVNTPEDGVYNVGTGQGYSVNSVVKIAEEITGIKRGKNFMRARKEDPQMLIADIRSAKLAFGFSPKYTIEDIIKDEWRDLNGKPFYL